MRKISLSALLLVAVIASAAPIDHATALQHARQFLAQKHPANGRRALRAAATAGSLTDAAADAYYVFNIADDHGFVIVSGDDRTQPILGYSDSGTFDADRLPANFKAWLDGYADQLQQLDRVSATITPSGPQKAPRRAKAKYTIAPLLLTTWNQGPPYNDKCPPFFDFGQTVTGCVATALAQVMFYHQWPAATVAEIPAYECRTLWTGYGRISVPAVAAGTSFVWDQMKHTYMANGDDPDACSAVATLMAACGASVGMNYSTDANGGSNASLVATAQALRTYFDYSATTRAVYRNDYTYAEWTDLIYAELEANRPVLYSGQASGGGHAFVVDGYDGEGLFHINWGWGGHANGYYMLSVALPSDAGGIGSSRSKDGYSYDQDAVIGIKKHDDEVVSQPLMTSASAFAVTGTTLSYDSYNLTGATHTFDIGFAFVAADGTLTDPVWVFSNTELDDRYGFSAEYIRLDVSTLGLSDGVYKLVPASKLASDTEPQSPLRYDREYALVSVENGEATVSLHTPAIQLKATELAAVGTASTGTDTQVQVKVQNEGDEFYGVLYLCQESQVLAQVGVTIGAGQTATVPFFFKPATAGPKQLAVALDQAGTNIVGTGTIQVAEGGSTQPALALAGISYDYDEGHALYGRFSGTLHISNTADTDFDGQVRINLMCNTEEYGTFEWLKNEYVNCHIAAGQTADVPFDIDQLGYNYYYAFQLYADKTCFYQQWDCKRQLLPGVITYFADGTKSASKPTGLVVVPEQAAAVDLTSTQTTAVEGGNPNTIYFLGTDDALPSGLTTNVVRDNEAQQLSLHGGTDFYTPADFIAHHITYTCHFDRLLTDQQGWHTLVLPFHVQRIEATIDGETATLGWLKSADQTDAALSLLAFEREEADVLHFTYADALQANRPYLIALNRADLIGTDIRFSGEEADISSLFRGSVTAEQVGLRSTLAAQQHTNVFTLDDTGSKFVLQPAATVQPFSSYVVPLGCDYNTLYISIPDVLVGINSLPAARPDGTADSKRSAATWHTLSGQRVAKPTRGIYLHNGKKTLVR